MRAKRQLVATHGNSFARFCGFWGRRICDRLPPVATARCGASAIRERDGADGERARKSRLRLVLPMLVRAGRRVRLRFEQALLLDDAACDFG
jgi:hypothetical protein